MRKIENFAQISDLLNAQLKKGVITNNFLRGDDYTREIANGLYIHEADGALLLFRERGTHLVMTFYLHPNACFPCPKRTGRSSPSFPAAPRMPRQWQMPPRSSVPSVFVRFCAARGAPANRKHFRWKQPQFLQSRRISRIFPAF